MLEQNRIQEIAGINIKGRNFRHRLDKAVAIQGDNAAGKTAITDAIMIAVLGHHPALGKKPSATMQLAPDASRQMEVEARTSAGITRRTFTRTKTGASLESTGATMPEIQTAQLWFQDFTNAKPTDRHEILNSLMAKPSASGLIESLQSKLASAGLLDLIEITINPNSSDPYGDAGEQLAEAEKAMKQSVDIARKTLAGMAMHDAMQEAVSFTEAEIEEAETKAKELYGAMKIAAVELDRTSERSEKAPDKPEQPRPAQDLIEATKAELAAAKDKLQDATDNLKSLTPLAQIRGMEAALAELEKDFCPDTPEPPVMTDEEMQMHLEQAKERHLEARNKHVAASVAHKQACFHNAYLKKKHHDLKEHGVCPCCGIKGEILDAALSQIEKQVHDASDALETLNQKNKASIEAVERAEEEAVRWKHEIQRSRLWANYLKAEELRTRIREEKERWERAPQIEPIEREIQKLQRAVEIDAALTKQWDEYERYEIPTADDIESLIMKHDEAKRSFGESEEILVTMRKARAQWLNATLETQKKERLQTEADETEKHAKAIAEIRQWIKQAKRDAAAEAIKPLADLAAILMEGLIEGSLATREHQVGLERGEVFLPLEVLSGMETLIIGAACQTAIAQKSELPILIVDEMPRMTQSRRIQFAQNCLEAIDRGIISQVIMVDQPGIGYGPHIQHITA